MGQGERIARKSFLDNTDHIIANTRRGHSSRKRAQLTKRLFGLGHLRCHFSYRIILDDPRTRNIFLLRFQFAPARHRNENRKLLLRLEPNLDALPCILGFCPVGFYGCQNIHFLGEPRLAAIGIKHSFQSFINRAQMRDVRKGIGELLIGERPSRPIGKAR